jgi:hypothetical protein
MVSSWCKLELVARNEDGGVDQVQCSSSNVSEGRFVKPMVRNIRGTTVFSGAERVREISLFCVPVSLNHDLPYVKLRFR